MAKLQTRQASGKWEDCAYLERCIFDTMETITTAFVILHTLCDTF